MDRVKRPKSSFEERDALRRIIEDTDPTDFELLSTRLEYHRRIHPTRRQFVPQVIQNEEDNEEANAQDSILGNV